MTTPDRDQIKKWLRLHLTNEVGAVTFARLLEYFGSIDEVLAASPGHLSSVPRISSKRAQRIADARDRIDVDDELALADQLGVHILTLESPDYPPALKTIHDPPPVLYVQGQLTRSDSLAVAIVGSRSCSLYGREQASRFAHLLAAAGFTIVSGLARGIDTAAHQGALAAQGRTIAVQGRGLAEVYPPENTDLAQDITRSAAVISEFPLRYSPLQKTFPLRNRIISGLCLATIIVEARPRSGALITARLATEQNREVMAVPGRLDNAGSTGPHRLIQDGAKLVQNVQDVLDALGHLGSTLNDHVPAAADRAQAAVQPAPLFDATQLALTDNESTLFDRLDHDPQHIDQLIAATGLSAAQTSAALTSLQLKGLIKQLPGSYYHKPTPKK